MAPDRIVEGLNFPVCKGLVVAVPTYRSFIALQALCVCFASTDGKIYFVFVFQNHISYGKKIK